jgi:hypothetical protein
MLPLYVCMYTEWVYPTRATSHWKGEVKAPTLCPVYVGGHQQEAFQAQQGAG